MSLTIFSRSFLQGIPEQRKQQHIDGLIQESIHMLQNTAAEGKTSYFYDSNNCCPTITIDDLVSTFKRKFPDCDISYKETWVENKSIQYRFLKKGINIDWS